MNNKASDIDGRVMAKLQKLLALARQGVGGEKDNAQSVLHKLLSRYGLTIADLDDSAEVRETRWFEPKNKDERLLLNHCIEHVLGDAWDGSSWRIKGTKRRGYDLTKAENAYVDLLFSIHRRAMRAFIERQKKAAISAYIHKNKLFSEATSSEEAKALSPEQMREIALIVAMMQGLDPTPVHKALPNRAAT